MAIQQTLVIIKPDCLQRNLVGEVITRFERKGLRLAGIKMMQLDADILGDHYAHHKERPFFPNLVDFMSSAPAIVMVWEGIGAIDAVRLIAGITKAREADGGTIRGDLALSQQFNLIHASDSLENAKAEISRFFDNKEIYEYKKIDFIYTHAEDERKIETK